VSQTQAQDFVHLCCSPEIGFLEATTFSKAATARLVSAVKTHCKAVVLAVFHDLYVRQHEILSGTRNGGANVNEVCIELLDALMAPTRRSLFALQRTPEQKGSLFVFFETHLCDPSTTPFTMAFLDWLDARPLDALTLFVAANHRDILADIPNACTYIMETFDARHASDAAAWALYDVVHGMADNGASPCEYHDDEAVKRRLGPELWASIMTPIRPLPPAAPPAAPPTVPTVNVVVPASMPVQAAASLPIPIASNPIHVHGPSRPTAPPVPTEYMPSSQYPYVTLPQSPPGATISPFRISIKCASVDEAAAILRYAESLRRSYR
jgi:hypothetical protein